MLSHGYSKMIFCCCGLSHVNSLMCAASALPAVSFGQSSDLVSVTGSLLTCVWCYSSTLFLVNSKKHFKWMSIKYWSKIISVSMNIGIVYSGLEIPSLCMPLKHINYNRVCVFIIEIYTYITLHYILHQVQLVNFKPGVKATFSRFIQGHRYWLAAQ